MIAFPETYPADFILRLILNPQDADPLFLKQLRGGQWDSLLRLAQKNVVLLRIFGHLEKMGVSPPSSFLDVVRAESLRVRRTLEFIQELDQICSNNSIPFVFTKAFQHYPDMGHDVDLFVMDRSRLIDSLIQQKFRARSLGGSFFNRVAGKTAYEIEGFPSCLEIHHARLGHVGEHAWYARLMTARRMGLTHDGVRTFVPSSEDQLILQVIQRVYDHMYLRLSDVIQAFQLIRDNDLNWNYLKTTTRKMEIADGFSYYLDSIRGIGPCALKEQALAQLSSPTISWQALPKVYFRDSLYRLSLFKTAGFLRFKQLLGSLRAGQWSSVARLCLLPFLGLAVGLRSLLRAALSRTYRATIFTEAVNLVSAIFVYRLAANHLGHDGFGEYVLTRKSASLLLPVLMLGLDTGIARNIAFNRGSSDDSRARAHYFLGGFLSILLMTLISGLGFYFFKDKLAFFLYGNQNYAHLLFPLGLLLMGTCLVNISYSYFQGMLDMTRANALQLVHYGVLPLAVLLISGGQAANILTVLGVCSLACAIVAVGGEF